MHWYIEAIKQYAVIEGRASRKEYWLFLCWHIVLLMGFPFAAAAIGVPDGVVAALVLLYFLFSLPPWIAVGVRRIHDVGECGAWLFVPFFVALLLLKEGDYGDNEYGPDPRLPLP